MRRDWRQRFQSIAGGAVFAMVVFLIFPLVMTGCKKPEERPGLSFHMWSVHQYPDTFLWTLDEVYGRTPTSEVLEIKQRAREVGRDDWADNCRWYDCWCPLAAPYYEQDEAPEWLFSGMEENPAKRLYYMVMRNEWAGQEWYLKNDLGEKIVMWGRGTARPHYLLNLSQWCPRGVIEESNGRTVVEYMTGPWLDVFLKTRWLGAFDGFHCEDGPPPVIRWYEDQFDTTRVVPAPGMEPMEAREFRDQAYEHYKQWLTGCVKRLGRMGVLTRCNGHFDYEVCEWQDPLLVDHAQTIWECFNAPKLEHVGRWGGCPQRHLGKWTEIMFRIEDHFHPFTKGPEGGTRWDGFQGWDVGCAECGVESDWPDSLVYAWQRKIVAFALMSEMVFNVKCRDAHMQFVPFGPHALFKLGRPDGPAREWRYYPNNPIYYRRFHRGGGSAWWKPWGWLGGGQTYTVAWNPWTFAIKGIPREDGVWFEGRWPDGKWKRFEPGE